MTYFQNIAYQTDRVILLEFENTDLYERHYISLFSFCSNMGYDSFQKSLYSTNKQIAEKINTIDSNLKDWDDFLKIKNQARFPESPWIIPWVEFVDDEFLCTLTPETIQKNGEVKKAITKSIYFFIEKKRDIDFFLSFTENTLWFYKTDELKYPITLRFLTGLKCYILRLELIGVEFDFRNFKKNELDHYNFIYFCKTLKDFWNIIEEREYRITAKEFNSLFIKILKRTIHSICN